MPPVLNAVLFVNIAMFVGEVLVGDSLVAVLALWPPDAGFMPWQIVTYAFLHANLAHLLANMFGLWMFGRDVENALGSIRFATLYGVSIFTGALTQLVVIYSLARPIPTLGASGAVFGVLVAFAMLFPRRVLMLLFPPIPMQARTFVIAYALLELYAGIAGTEAGVAHFAHLGGLVGGFTCIHHWRRRDAAGL